MTGKIKKGKMNSLFIFPFSLKEPLAFLPYFAAR